MKPQSGVALLLLLLLLISTSLVWLTRRLPPPPTRDMQADGALREAKEALLGYAAAYPEYHLKGSPERAAHVPGHLPCPDTGVGIEGQEAPNCGNTGVTVIGRLPWKTLGLPPLRDSQGHCLWYAVGGNYKANPKADLLNPDIPGQFQILGPDGNLPLVGSTAPERPVAVIFAPGPPLAGQSRAHQGGECGKDYDPKQFLDALQGIDNSTPTPTPEGLTRLIMAPASPQFNDRLLWISREEIFSRRVALRPTPGLALFDDHYAPSGGTPALTQRVAACLARFAAHNDQGRLPWAAPLELTAPAPNTFRNDQFADQTGLHQGRPPFSVGHSLAALGYSLKTLPSFPGCIYPNGTGCRLLRSDNCPELLPAAGYPTPSDLISAANSPDGWWDKWKDHLFYTVARDFAPAPHPAGDCSNPDNCLWVGSRGPFAAIVLFAGEALPGQTRETTATRLQPENYLEGGNQVAFREGNAHLEIAGNDQLACITLDLQVTPNCGNDQCLLEADKLRTLIGSPDNHCRTESGVHEACVASHEALTGCACRGAATRLIQPPCLDELNLAACQRALTTLKTCI